MTQTNYAVVDTADAYSYSDYGVLTTAEEAGKYMDWLIENGHASPDDVRIEVRTVVESAERLMRD